MPSHTPAQLTFTCAGFGAIGGGAVIMNCTVVSQPAASVMVTFHVPGQSCEAVAVFWPTGGAGFQTKPYVGVPPVGTTVAVPLQRFAQVAFVPPERAQVVPLYRLYVYD